MQLSPLDKPSSCRLTLYASGVALSPPLTDFLNEQPQFTRQICKTLHSLGILGLLDAIRTGPNAVQYNIYERRRLVSVLGNHPSF